MNPFHYTRASDVADAIRQCASGVGWHGRASPQTSTSASHRTPARATSCLFVGTARFSACDRACLRRHIRVPHRCRALEEVSR